MYWLISRRSIRTRHVFAFSVIDAGLLKWFESKWWELVLLGLSGFQWRQFRISFEVNDVPVNTVLSVDRHQASILCSPERANSGVLLLTRVKQRHLRAVLQNTGRRLLYFCDSQSFDRKFGTCDGPL
jgi:hypothetical protein